MLYPPPKLKVPVGFSVTSILRTIWSSALPGRVSHFDVVEIVQALQVAHAAFELRAAVELLLIDAELAADDLVAGLGVAADDDLLK